MSDDPLAENKFTFSHHPVTELKILPQTKMLGKVKSQPPIRMKPIMSQLLNEADEENANLPSQASQNHNLSDIAEESPTGTISKQSTEPVPNSIKKEMRPEKVLRIHQENNYTHHGLSHLSSSNESFDNPKQHTYPSFEAPGNFLSYSDISSFKAKSKTPKSSENDVDFLLERLDNFHIATPQSNTKEQLLQKSPLDLAVPYKSNSAKKNSKIVKCLDLTRPEEAPKILTPSHRNKEEAVFATPMMKPPPNNNKLTDTGKKFPHKQMVVNGKVYNVLSTLGAGGSSKVFQVMETESSQIYAVKCVNLQYVDKSVAKGYLNEVKLLLKLQNSPNVIRLLNYEYISEKKILYVVMEKGDTDFSKLIKNISKSRQISVAMIIYFWLEMLNAVKYIHSNGIVHSDLKPSNFLLVSGTLKLIDFGIASSLQNDMTSIFKEGPMGTYNYMSPEAIQDPNCGSDNPRSKVSFKSDVWSLGCILYNLVYGRTPFQHITNSWKKLTIIMDPKHDITFKDPPLKCPPILIETLRRCLAFNPKDRPNVEDLISIPYISNTPLSPSNIENKESIIISLLNQIRPAVCQEDWQRILKIYPQISRDINK